MLKELFQAVGETAVKAAGPKVLTLPGEPGHVYGIANADGTIRLQEANPPPRDHKAGDLAAVAMFAAESQKLDHAPEVWYSRKGVVCFAERTERRDRATLPLAHSPQFVKLAELERSKCSMDQRTLIRLLRVDLKVCLGPAGGLVDLLRQVKFAVNQSGESEVKHGSSSVGKAIRSELTAMDKLPEYVTLSVPVFDRGFVFSAAVQCALEPDAGTQTFQLIPMPGDLERAAGLAEVALGVAVGEALAEANASDVPAYYGAA